MSSKYKLSSPNGMAAIGSPETGSSGCYVSIVHGAILLLLAVLISVGVGVIVFFAGGREVVCQCQIAEPEVVVTTPSTTLGPEAIKQMCIDIIKEGDGDEICVFCRDGNVTDGPNTPTAPAPTETPRDYRLPISVRPYLYKLEFQPNIYGTEESLFDFNGSGQIFTIAEQASLSIVLHVDATLNVSGLQITNINSTTDVVIADMTYEERREFYTLSLTSPLVIGNHYRIQMTFRGPLTQSGSGLYLSQYEEDGQIIYLAATQFQATNARKAFPCFDEPSLKAEFDISIIRKENTTREYISLANTPQLDSEQIGDGLVRDVFERTAPISTYLVAFMMCDYQYLEDNVTGVLYRTWAMPKKLEFARITHDHGIKIFERFNTYFNPQYQYRKLDNVPVPDFGGGAMENWGLIVYRDIILLDPQVSTALNEAWTISVTSHELSHQWFGNLVTLEWWNWLWLNEGLASFWEYHMVDELYPEWRMLDKKVTDDFHTAFSVDSLLSSHPLTASVMAPGEISSIFDAITYNKGGAVTRMMHLAMGQELFIKGLNRYLTANKFGNVDQYDLWKALTEEANANSLDLNMTEIMDPWVAQSNFPVVNVHIDRNQGQITLTQQRFLLSNKNDTLVDKSAYNYRWTIPITYTTSSNPNFTTEYLYDNVHFFKYYDDKLVLNATIPSDGWVMVNLQQAGFYRVNYDTENWMRIINQTIEDIHPINRAQVINDAWNLAKAGLLNQSIALETINNLGQDFDYAPWRAFIREIGYIDNMLERTDIFGSFEVVMRNIVSKPFTELGTNVTADMLPIEKLKISQIVSQACQYDLPECVDAATSDFRTWRNNVSSNPIPLDVREVFYCTSVRNGNTDDWLFVYEQYHQAQATTEKVRLRRALTCTKQPWLLQRVLDMSIDADEIRPQDSWETIGYVSRSPWGREMSWNFLTHHFHLLANLVKTFSGVSKLVRDVTAKFNTEVEYKQVETFMKTEDVSAAGDAFQQILEQIRTNIHWLEENYNVFKIWLETQTRR